MKRLLSCAIVALLAAPIAAPLVQAVPLVDGVQIVANPGVAVNELTAGDLKEIFLGIKTAVAGAAVEPVFTQAGEAHLTFLKTYLGKSDSALRNHFKTLVFTGKGTQPKSFATDAEVLKYVMKTKGAIGYVSAATETGGAKKIQVR